MWSRSTGRAAGRLAARHGREFVRHVVPAVVKPARTLWNEFIGFVFLCFGGTFAYKTGRIFLDSRKAPSGDPFKDMLLLSVSGFCTLVMLGFSLSSFLKARRISRS